MVRPFQGQSSLGWTCARGEGDSASSPQPFNHMNGILYILRSPNGKRYVGITSKTLQCRWNQHVWNAKVGGTSVLAKAVRKYGPESFSKIIVCVAEWDFLNWLEAKAIKELETVVPFGYNLRLGGDQHGHSPASRLKMAITRRKQVIGTQAHSEAVSRGLRTRWAAMDPEQKHNELSRRTRKGHAGKDPLVRSAQAKHAATMAWSRLSKEERAARTAHMRSFQRRNRSGLV